MTNPFIIRPTGNNPIRAGGNVNTRIGGTSPPPPPPPPPTGSRYLNRPAWATSVVSDYGFSDTIAAASPEGTIGSGWQITWNGGGNCSRVEDVTAPFSPNYVAQWRYPNGMTPGDGVGNINRTFSSTQRIYFALDIKWDASYQFHPISTKLLYLEPTNTILQMMWGNEMMIHRGSGTEFPDGLRHPFTNLGEWVHLEYVADATDDYFSVWINDNLVIHWEPSGGVTGGWTETSINSTWGGAGGSKSGDSYRWLDHILIARP